MKETFKDIIIELDDDTIMIRNAQTNELIRARVYRAHEAIDKFKDLCEIYRKKVTT